MTYAMYHKSGCGNIAWYLDYQPVEGSVMTSTGITKLDGSSPVIGDPVICGSCLAHMKNISAHDVVKV